MSEEKCVILCRVEKVAKRKMLEKELVQKQVCIFCINIFKFTMAWSHRKNAGHSNLQKDVVWKAECNKTQRKTKNEMAG
jgi:hypothetical protein